MPVDNELYNRLSSTWWDENEPLNLLRTSINPGRFGYFRDVLVKQLKIDPHGSFGRIVKLCCSNTCSPLSECRHDTTPRCWHT